MADFHGLDLGKVLEESAAWAKFYSIDDFEHLEGALTYDMESGTYCLSLRYRTVVEITNSYPT